LQKTFIIYFLLTILLITKLFAHNTKVLQENKDFEKSPSTIEVNSTKPINILNLTHEEQKFLNSKKVILTQAEKNYSPFLFEQNNQIVGIIPDLLKLIEKKINKKIEYIETKSANQYNIMLDNKKIDFINHRVKREKSEDTFLYSDKVIFNTNIGLFYDNKKQLSLGDIENKKIGSVKGYHTVKIIKKIFPKAKLILFDTNDHLIKGLISKQVDAGITNYDITSFLIKTKYFSSNIDGEILDNEYFTTKTQHFAFNQNNKILKSIFDKALEQIDNKEFNAIFSKWLSQNLINKTTLSKKEQEYIKKNKEFTVCTRINHYPISLEKNNKLFGISGDIFDEIEKHLDIKFNILSIKSEEDFVNKVVSNKCDFISALKVESKQYENIKISNRIYDVHFGVLSGIKAPYLKFSEDLKEHTFYVKDNIHYELTKTKYPNINLKLEPNVENIINKIQNNPKYHMIQNEYIIGELIKTYGFNKIKMNGELAKLYSYGGVGINIVNHPIMLSIINKTINKIGSKKINKIQDSYLINKFYVENKNIKYILLILLLLMIFTIFLFRKYRELKKQKKIIDIQKEHLERITHEQNTLLSLFDKGDSVLFKWKNDENWTIKYVSNNVENLLGYTKEDFLNSNITYADCIHKADFTRVLEEVKKGEQCSCSFFKHEPYRVITKDNKTKWILDYTVTHKDRSGKVKYFIGYLHDVTEETLIKKQLLDSEFRWKFAVEGSKDGLWDWDIKTNNVYFSIQWKNMLGFKDHEITNTLQEWEKRVHPDDIKRVYEDITRHMKGETETYQNEHRMLCKDGKYKWILDRGIIVSKDENEEPLRFIGTHTDISVQKNFEAELKEANIKEKKANAIKSEFLANMSHEIRTPLNGVIGLTDLVLETQLDNIQKEYLQKIKYSSHSLLHIVNDILDYSKIEANKLDIVLSPANIYNTFKNISHLFSHQISKKGLEFNFTIEPNIPEVIIADHLRIIQVLNNFIGNSFKFTNKGYIQVDLKILDKDEKFINLQFSVIDTGIGIAKENKYKLFQTFSQEDTSTTKKFGGTGLGLSISKQLIELMGGEVFFESKKDVGSTFGFRIKLSYQGRREFSNTKDKHYKSILVVDDNEIDRDYLSILLKRWHIKSYKACNGIEAYNILQTKKFDYIILDWKMPNLDGLELIEKLKNSNINTPQIMMVTAHNKNTLLYEAKNKNISLNKIIQKPYTPSIIFNTLFDTEDSILIEQIDVKNIKLIDTKKALLVEDNEINQTVAMNLLKNIGFEVTIAKNGKESVELVADENFDIIFMDIQMPVMDGFEATRLIRKFNEKTPIIALSAAVMNKDKELTKSVGMNHHIAKPIDKKELFDIIDEYFDIESNDKNIDKEQIESINGIDIQKVKEKLQIPNNEIYKMYDKFEKEYNNTSNKKELDYTSKEFKDFIHKVKGVSGNLEIKELFEVAKLIHDENQVKKTKDFFDILEKTCNDIKTKISSKIVDNLEKLEKKDIENFILEMINSYKNYEFIKPEKKELLIYNLKEKIEEKKFIKLEKALNDYDNEQIVKNLENILEFFSNK
jgi:PAS domain S-box-containing protein